MTIRDLAYSQGGNPDEKKLLNRILLMAMGAYHYKVSQEAGMLELSPKKIASELCGSANKHIAIAVMEGSVELVPMFFEDVQHNSVDCLPEIGMVMQLFATSFKG